MWKQFMGGSLDDRPKAYRLASPLEHLDKDDPPCLFITGETDDESTRAAKFRKRMSDLGVSSEIEVIEGAPHGFLNKQIWSDQMIEAADAHFKKTLREAQ